MLKLQTHASIREIEQAQWDALLGEDPEPFLRWTFLDALEQTGCVGPRAGWIPTHLALYRDELLLAAAPAYLKTNSEGEFVFDYGWAEFAERRLGLQYYPKLVIAPPFTPATGRRLLTLPSEPAAPLRELLLDGVKELCDQLGLSSAHVLFPSGSELEAYTGLLHRQGVQYHWHNPGYRSFDDFLQRFTAKKRHQIKRERRQLNERGITVELVGGRDATAPQIAHMYDFYRSTVERHLYGNLYLNRAFFEEVCARMPESIVLVLASSSPESAPIAGAFNLVGAGAMYGRYWGAREKHEFLHFEVCYYRGIEECIARGLQRFEPGAGGDHKLVRGFEPTLTHSFHVLRDERLTRVVADFVERERRAVQEYCQQEAGLLKPWPLTESELSSGAAVRVVSENAGGHSGSPTPSPSSRPGGRPR